MALAFGLTTLIQSWIDAGQRPSIGWQFAAFIIITASEVMVVIVALEFAYTQAPHAMKSLVMALFWLSVWGGNQFTAQVNHAIAIPSAAAVQFAAATAKLPADWRNAPRSIVLPGYDGTTGTSDDFIARCKNGQLVQVEIPGKSGWLQAAARVEAASLARFPSPAAGQALLADLRDPWGNPLRYELIDSAHARISSNGPDHLPKTAWDLGLLIEKVSASPPHARDTWLARRKAELGLTPERQPGGFVHREFCGGQSRLEGADYFAFFTLLVVATTLLFFPFAYFYRPRTYLYEG